MLQDGDDNDDNNGDSKNSKHLHTCYTYMLSAAVSCVLTHLVPLTAL